MEELGIILWTPGYKASGLSTILRRLLRNKCVQRVLMVNKMQAKYLYTAATNKQLLCMWNDLMAFVLKQSDCTIELTAVINLVIKINLLHYKQNTVDINIDIMYKSAYLLIKVRKTARIRYRYNQVPHLSQNTSRENNKNTINITNKSQEVSPFPAGAHKAAMNRRESMRNTRHKKDK